MNLLVALITYNRLECTKRTLKSFTSTIEVPYQLIVADNASTDGTVEWLMSKTGWQILGHERNVYPGKACNEAWEMGMLGFPQENFTHLMRLDNDMEFAPGWSKKAQEYFERYPQLGQLGLDFDALRSSRPFFYDWGDEDLRLSRWPGNIGGTNIIRREVFDQGVRYDETPWRSVGNMPTAQEDVDFSKTVKAAGWDFGHMTERYCWTFATPDIWDEDPDYYMKTMSERGYRSTFPEFFAKHEKAGT